MPGLPVKAATQQDQQFVQLQQQAAAHMNAKQYTDALVAVDQMLQLQPNHHIAKELQKVLTEKIELDASQTNTHDAAESDQDGDNSSEDTSSNTASSDGSQEEADQGSSSDTDSDNSESPIRPVTTCDTLQMERNDQVLSAQQRQQLRSRLADQLEELRVQQAAQSMDVLGL